MLYSIDFIIYPEALGLDISGPLEVFNVASRFLTHLGRSGSGYKIRFAALKKGEYSLSSGLKVIADVDLDEKPPAHTVLVPGGDGVQKVSADPVFIEKIRHKCLAGKRIVSVCNGSFILASAGLLDNRRATTHWMKANEFTKTYPKVKLEPDAIFVQDGHVYTSGGVTAGIDLALALVERDFGVSLAIEVSRTLLVYFRRPASQSQFSTPLKAEKAAGSRFVKLHRWLLTNIQDKISVEQMADFSAMSERNFSRVFKQATGLTPIKYLETLRLDRAKEILSSGKDTLEAIAASCGFENEERLRRAFRRRFQLTPSQYRCNFNKY